MLNKFLKSNFTTERLTSFIKEICLEYSELLFYSNQSLNEIKELKIVENALNERFRNYYKYSVHLERQLNEIKSTILGRSHDETTATVYSSSEKQEYQNKYYEAVTELNRLKQQNDIFFNKINFLLNKQDEIWSEYISFKTIYLGEIRNLKYDLEQTLKERNEFRNSLIEFKAFFNQLVDSKHIQENSLIRPGS